MSAVSDRLLEQFLRACGADGPLELDVAIGDGPAEPRSLHQPFAVVGRDPNADLRIDHPQISRRHAYLQLIGGRVFCVDLGSRTGLHWGDSAGRAGWLDAGQPLRAGPATIRLECERSGWDMAAADISPLAARAPQFDPLPLVTLEFPRGSKEPRSCSFDRVLMLVGRAPECRLRLGDPDVSKFHCSLVRTPTGVWAVDLFGRDGIIVNGTRTRFARLDHGGHLQAGRHQIRFIYHAPRMPLKAIAYAKRDTGSTLAVEHPEVSHLLAGRPADQVELAGMLLGPLLSEFGALQQQMAEIQQRRSDEFQHALMTMFQMFGAMHRDQMNLIREEMDQINRLAQEQRALESKLAEHATVRPASLEEKQPAAATPRTGEDTPLPRPSAANPDRDPSGPILPAQEREKRSTRARAAESPTEVPQPSLEPVDPNMHAWLNQRIMSIQQEKQGRWQKLISSVMGRNLGEDLP
jgi:pSer/pThr/pTyr-binding forkhead associated (FHA) protein